MKIPVSGQQASHARWPRIEFENELYSETLSLILNLKAPFLFVGHFLGTILIQPVS